MKSKQAKTNKQNVHYYQIAQALSVWCFLCGDRPFEFSAASSNPPQLQPPFDILKHKRNTFIKKNIMTFVLHLSVPLNIALTHRTHFFIWLTANLCCPLSDLPALVAASIIVLKLRVLYIFVSLSLLPLLLPEFHCGCWCFCPVKARAMSLSLVLLLLLLLMPKHKVAGIKHNPKTRSTLQRRLSDIKLWRKSELLILVTFFIWPTSINLTLLLALCNINFVVNVLL